MNFQEAEHWFQELERKWAGGQLDEHAYRQALANIRVRDAAGETWMMQEHTGRWFVFRGGQWVAAQRPASQPVSRPPVQPPRAQPVPQPAAMSAAPSAQPAAVKAPRRTVSLLLVAGLLAACVVCAGLGAAEFLVITGRIQLPPQLAGLLTGSKEAPAGQPTPAAVEKTVETVEVIADGTPHADSRGVTLTVPVDAVEAGGKVILAAADFDAPWRKAIESAVKVETPFYSLTAQGKNDTPGSLALRFPATSPNARLLAVIDNEYLVELAQVPQNGQLTLQTRAGPSDAADLKPPEGYDGTGSIAYAVIVPKGSTAAPGRDQMVGWHFQGEGRMIQADERNCIPDISIIGGAAVNLCRQNPAGTVQVMLPNTKRDLLPQVDIMVDKIEAVMKKYYELGFTTAQLSSSSPMLVRVSTTVTSPSYYPLNGVLYIPVDTVTRIASLSPTDVYHEMAHWIQAVKYSTRLAYYSGERTWWLETSAENMVMLVEPDYVGSNLTTYGTISNGDSSLALQSEPYQWPGDYYVQAQFVKINLCDSADCPLSPASFASAISEGKYPLMDGAKKSMMSANLKNYAYYLLGKFPVSANTNIPLSGPVKTGEGYGEYVRITRTNSTDLKYDYNGSEPQMRKESKDGKESLVLEAKLQLDGVYPLMVLGGAGNNPGLPVQLIIDPGAPFYYTIDDGELMYASGGEELKILPIHGAMGIKKVRIVAVGEHGAEVFKARVEPLDLQGTWVTMISGEKTGGAMTCSGGSGETENPDGIAVLMSYMMSIVGGTGEMKAEPTGRGLDWSQIPSRVPAEVSEANASYQAAALLAGDAVKFQASLDIPKEDDSSSLPPILPIASALGFLQILWLVRKRLNLHTIRLFTNVFVIALLVFLCTGCFGMGMYGNSTVDAKFDKFEYVGKEDTGVLTLTKDFSPPSGEPIWKMTGTATFNVNFFIETTLTDQDGKENTEVTTCTGQVTYPVNGYIYKDFTVSIPAE